MSTLQSEYPKDRRIAELEAAMLKYGRHLPTCYGDTCDCGFCDLDEPAELRAALAAAKREALEAGIKFCMESVELNRKASRRPPMYERDVSQEIFSDLAQEDEVIAGELRRMAQEVKP